MFDIYESILNCEKISDKISLREQFAAWCFLKELEVVDNEGKNEFLDEILPGEGDLLERILQYEEDKASLIRFLMLDFNRTSINRISYTIDIEKEQRSKDYWTLEKIALKLGISIDLNKEYRVHRSYFRKGEIRFFYFRKTGVLFLIDLEIKDRIDSRENKEKQLNLFRALSDEKRLLMIAELSKGECSASDLSRLCNISLSTVNHHMKMLIEQRLASLSVSSSSGRGAMYTLNKANLLELLQQYMEELQ